MAHWGSFKERYLADSNPYRQKRVHDLSNEKSSCALQTVEWGGNALPFATLEAAKAAGYVPCLFCLPQEENAG